MYAVRTDDCIVAISSPAGQGARGILRISGPSAVTLCGGLFRANDGRSLDLQVPWRLVPGWLAFDSQTAVPCNVVIFLPPRSYTGQPLVEFHLAGAPALLEMVLRGFTAAGARLAEPGEFTARAFLTGRMDLLSAEAVAERIAARSDAQLTAAQELATGALAERIGAATDELTDLFSLVEAGIDFADEPIEFIEPAALVTRLAALRSRLEDLLARSIDMQRLEVLPRVALLGPMSAGKSSLVNRLTGLDRSICSPIPGTTRDVLSAVMNTPAGAVLLLDGPGLGLPRCDLDGRAQSAWRELLLRVDLVLLVLPADQVYDAWSRRVGAGWNDIVPPEVAQALAAAARPRLLVLNKRDLLSAEELAQLSDATGSLPFGSAGEDTGGTVEWGGNEAALDRAGCQPQGWLLEGAEPAGICAVSAATGAGCDDLWMAIGQAVAGMTTSSQGRIVLTARHSQSLQAALTAIAEAMELVAGKIGQTGKKEKRGQTPEQHKGSDPFSGSDPGVPAELIALHLRDAATELGQISGSVTTEDLLERVFSRFCIGK